MLPRRWPGSVGMTQLKLVWTVLDADLPPVKHLDGFRDWNDVEAYLDGFQDRPDSDVASFDIYGRPTAFADLRRLYKQAKGIGYTYGVWPSLQDMAQAVQYPAQSGKRAYACSVDRSDIE